MRIGLICILALALVMLLIVCQERDSDWQTDAWGDSSVPESDWIWATDTKNDTSSPELGRRLWWECSRAWKVLAGDIRFSLTLDKIQEANESMDLVTLAARLIEAVRLDENGRYSHWLTCVVDSAISVYAALGDEKGELEARQLAHSIWWDQWDWRGRMLPSFKRSLELAERSNDVHVQAEIHYQVGNWRLHKQRDDYDPDIARYHKRRAFDLYLSAGEKVGGAGALSGISTSFAQRRHGSYSPDSALYYRNAALDAYRELSDTVSIAFALSARAHLDDTFRTTGQRLDDLREAARLFSHTDYYRYEPVMWMYAGEIFSENGQYDSAAQCFQRQASCYNDDDYTRYQIYGGIAAARFRNGERESALALWQEIYDYRSQIDDPYEIAHLHLEIGNEQHYAEAWEEALAHLEPALEFFLEVGDSSWIEFGCKYAGECWLKLGEFEKARDRYQTRLMYISEYDNLAFYQSHEQIGKAFGRQRELDSAVRYLTVAIDTVEALGSNVQLAGLLVELGSAYLSSQDETAATTSFSRALSLVGSAKGRGYDAEVLERIATSYLVALDSSQALAFYDRAHRRYHDINWFDDADRIGRIIANLDYAP